MDETEKKKTDSEGIVQPEGGGMKTLVEMMNGATLEQGAAE